VPAASVGEHRATTLPAMTAIVTSRLLAILGARFLLEGRWMAKRLATSLLLVTLGAIALPTASYGRTVVPSDTPPSTRRHLESLLVSRPDLRTRSGIAFMFVLHLLPPPAPAGGDGTRYLGVLGVDTVGEALESSRRYVLHFAGDALPPADGSWSVTLYPQDLFGDGNELETPTLGTADDPLYNPDGSLDIYIQRESPGRAHGANWLRPPNGRFNVATRFYRLGPAGIDANWTPPSLRRLDSPGRDAPP